MYFCKKKNAKKKKKKKKNRPKEISQNKPK